MKYDVIRIVLIIIFSADLHSEALYLNDNFSGRLKHNSYSFRYLYITQPNIAHEKPVNIRDRYVSTRETAGRASILSALNPKNAELHPESLSGVEPKITPEELEKLKKKGLLDGDAKSWRNWHIVTKGRTHVFHDSCRRMG